MDTHQPVLLEATLSALNIRPDGRYVDCTFGRGGHSRAILQQLGPDGRLLALDRDPQAIEAAKSLAATDNRFCIRHDAFTHLNAHLDALGWLGQVDGLLFDLGVSSPQLDNAERGFSFMHDGPLDMRMDTSSGQPVSDWLHHAGADEIADVLKRYGEERHARRIARTIVQTGKETPLQRTSQLAELVRSISPPQRFGEKHPATRTFQALRIFINEELLQLEQVLPKTLEALANGGRLVIISFHSLEDRQVKRFMRDAARGDPYPSRLPVAVSDLNPDLRLHGRAVMPDKAEISHNPRARSAILRVAERCR